MKRLVDFNRDFSLLEKSAEEIWEKIFRNEPSFLPAGERLTPAVDIYETRETLCLEVELPGVEREEIQLYTIQGVLFIEAEKKEGPVESKAGRGVNYLCVERKFGKVYREIELPKPCHPLKAKARFRNGILTVEFQKISERRGQRQMIAIES